MLQQSIVKKNLLFFFILLIAVAACNNADTGKNSSKSDSNSMTAMAMAETVKTATITAPELDYLWVDSATFLRIPKGKTVFSFSFSLPDSITLNGWHAKGNQNYYFDTIPDIKLIKGQPSGVSCGKGTYFGNEILDDKELQNIKDIIVKLKTLYVLFTPEVKDYHVKYNIVLTNENPLGAKALDKTKLIVTSYSLNPSPPHQY